MSLTDNIVSYWKLDESSGNAVDSVGSYTLTNTNTVGYATGKINNGADFGAINTNKDLRNTANLGMLFSTSFTYNFWMNVTTQPANNTAVNPITWADNTTANTKGYNEIQLYNDNGTLQVYIDRRDSAGGDQPGQNRTFTLGTWYMLTYTWDGSNQNLYLDGNATPILTGASTRTGTNSAPPDTDTMFTLGNAPSLTRTFDGLLDEVGVWSRALSTTEIAELYNNGDGIQYPFTGDSSHFLSLLGVGS